ncbi:MAG: metal-sulfur cluster assembly factor [Thermotogae bacterium]|nr:metal-sulfur cluster assembly factor [Thermotogota bacterium]
MEKITTEMVYEKLNSVVDPEIGIDIVSLGLVYDVKVDDNNDISVKMTMTVPECPLAGMIVADAQNVLEEMKGVSEVKVELVWDPPWSPDMIKPDIKKKLGIEN